MNYENVASLGEYAKEYAIRVSYSGDEQGFLQNTGNFSTVFGSETLTIKTFSGINEATDVMKSILAQYKQLAVHTATLRIVERTVTTTRSDWQDTP